MPKVTFRDARAFSLALGRVGKELPADLVGQVQRSTLLEGLGRIVDRTPVDTGRARGNWQVGEDSIGPVAQLAPDPTGSATKAAGASNIAQLPVYVRAFILNNLPYIEVLEFGGYPPPGQGPRRQQTYDFVTKDGKRKRVNWTAKRRAKEYALNVPKVTPQGFSIQAPRGMVGITFEELSRNLASLRFDDEGRIQ